MEGERRSLVLEFEPGMAPDDAAQVPARLIPTAPGGGQHEALSVRIAPFEPVLTCGRILPSGKEPIEVVERPAGDERERALRGSPQALHEGGQARIQLNDPRR